MTKHSLACVKSKNTRPEMLVRSALFALGKRFRLHVKSLPGSPDIVLPKYRMVIFVHGCFWHRHDGCKYAYTPKSNQSFWIQKFRQNVDRDSKNEQNLAIVGFDCKIIWECETRKPAVLEAKIKSFFPCLTV